MCAGEDMWCVRFMRHERGTAARHYERAERRRRVRFAPGAPRRRAWRGAQADERQREGERQSQAPRIGDGWRGRSRLWSGRERRGPRRRAERTRKRQTRTRSGPCGTEPSRLRRVALDCDPKTYLRMSSGRQDARIAKARRRVPLPRTWPHFDKAKAASTVAPNVTARRKATQDKR